MVYLGGTNSMILKNKTLDSFSMMESLKVKGVVAVPAKKVFFHPALATSEVGFWFTPSVLNLLFILEFLHNSRCSPCTFGKACQIQCLHQTYLPSENKVNPTTSLL